MTDHTAAPLASTEWLASLPRTEDEPSGSPDEKVVRAARTRPFRAFNLTRRHLIGSGLAIASATALNAFGRLPGFSIPAAYATVGSEYTNCAGYEDWTGYTNNTQLCVGGTYSRNYCGSDGWFKNSTVGGTTYYYPIVACGDGMTKRNAWRWTHYVSGTGRLYRCADGMMRISNGSYVFRICSYGF